MLVSTDKAVTPATVMGASKALAEWAVEAASARYPQTRYATVRFGNVLGSSGSVVPIFRRQIARGGPVTVTDERMTRYFMTIPEAVQLIIRAGSLGEGGEVFVLEMGEPVRIMRPRPRHDPALRPRARTRTSRSRSSGAGRARSSTRSSSTPTSARSRRRRRRSCAPSASRRRPGGSTATFDEVTLLVLEGDAAALAAKVAELAGERSTAGRARDGGRSGSRTGARH